MSNFQLEQKIQEEIYASVDASESFIFNAGAGAGKTYALIETIKYILKKNGKQLSKRNQRVVCITYTNVAANEIKERLGETALIKVSTIHELLWEEISPYKSLQLMNIHRDNLKSELKSLNAKIEEKKDDRNLNVCFENERFYELLTDEAKNIFYEIDAKRLSANDFRECYIQTHIDDHVYLSQALKNVDNFKNFMKNHFRRISYENAIEKLDDAIQSKKKIDIEYDPKVNHDRLASMYFSHDTLLKYSHEMFEKYPILCSVFINKYPYLFIDEYQDTDPNVIEITDLLYKIKKKSKFDWLVGYFGDDKQNIYDTGIGEELIKSNDNNLKVIDKKFNRRSANRVIDLINKIRDDSDFHQQSINHKNIDGEVKFFTKETLGIGLDNEIGLVNFTITKFKAKHPSAKNIHCLVALNKTIAELSEFEEVYNALGFIRWDNINSQFLSHDLDKLHPAILFIYKVLNLYKLLTSELSTYGDLFAVNKKSITLSEALSFNRELKNELPDAGTSLDGFIKHLFSKLSETTNPELKSAVLKSHLKEMTERNNIFSSECFYRCLKELVNSEDYETKELLDISLEIWMKWFSYINKEKKDIIYQTLHSSKGEEYENVIVILGHDFGTRQRGKFKKYFQYIASTENNDKPDDFENTRNLLYVAFSRAIENLWVLYTDSVDEIQVGIDKVFLDYK